jgi:dihydrofolate synthase/folylpolyglutamate synthase
VTYSESIAFLYNLQMFGMKFGLRGMHALLNVLDHPEKKFPSIHVAGTNGKGSTSSMLAAIFTAAGYRTGLYTSPHLVKFNERIRIDGAPISSGDIARSVSLLRPAIEKNRNTFFEAATCIAFHYFAESEVDIAIIETGLGGRLDATNVLRPLVSVITSIGLEHTHILGKTKEKIAFEKGGIIKRNVPCVCGPMAHSARAVVEKIAAKKNAPFIPLAARDVHSTHTALDGLTVDIRRREKTLDALAVSLPGKHQAINALLAVMAVSAIPGRYNLFVEESALRRGLKNIQQYSGLQARLSIIRKSPLLLADVAHNPDAVRALCTSLKDCGVHRMDLVFGLMKDKSLARIVSSLAEITRHVFVVEAHTERSRSAAAMVKEFQRHHVHARGFKSVEDGVRCALAGQKKRPVLITGSHFVVGEALAFLRREKYLTINQ